MKFLIYWRVSIELIPHNGTALFLPLELIVTYPIFFYNKKYKNRLKLDEGKNVERKKSGTFATKVSWNAFPDMLDYKLMYLFY